MPSVNIAVAVGSVVRDMRNIKPSAFSPVSLIATPGGGGTLRVEVSSTPTAVDDPGTARWLFIDGGALAAAAEIVRIAPCVALRITAATQPGNVDMSF